MTTSADHPGKIQTMNNPLPVPLAFIGKNSGNSPAGFVLAGDVGGTKTNLAVFSTNEGNPKLVAEATYHSGKFASCIDILLQFRSEHESLQPDHICIGVAGPVVDGKVEITNLNWNLDTDEIRKSLGVQNVSLLNDLEATAYGLAALTADDFITIHEGAGEFNSNMAIIAPGTGLGEAGLFWDGHQYHPFPTEGGHTDFSPRSEIDIELQKYLQTKYEVVSWEKVIAGPGIHDIYQFLIDIKKRVQPDWLKIALSRDDPSAVISQAALEEKDGACAETMQLFVKYLARESSNLVLKMKATSGLYLGGGIPPKIASLLQFNIFYNNFLDCDRMQHLLKRTPVKIILNPKTALLGAAYYGAFGI